MGKFNFKYESIKTVKEIIEKKAQKELAVVDKAITEKIEEIEQFIAYRKLEEKRFSEKKKMVVYEIKEFERFIDASQKKELEMRKELENLKKVRIQKQKELAEKGKEVKIFEKLKENHELDFNKMQNKEEQIEIDDIATKRFIRNMEQ